MAKDSQNDAMSVETATPVESPKNEEKTSTEASTEVQEPSKEEKKEEVKQEAPKEQTLEEMRQQYNLPAKWNESHLMAWRDFADKTHVKTKRGNWAYDPTRDMNNIMGWPFTLVEDWMDGELPNSDEKNPNLAVITRRYSQRKGISKQYTPLQVFRFVRFKETPKTTENGNVVETTYRDAHTASQWADSELKDWAKDQLPATANATDEQLASEAKERFKLINEATTVADIKKALIDNKKREKEPTPAGLTDVQATVIREELESYIKATAPNVAIGGTAGRRAQKQLQWVFDYIIKMDNKAFIAGMDLLVSYVRKYRQANFSETNAYRFVPELQNATQRSYHTGILASLLIVGGNQPLMIRTTDTSRYFEALGEVNAARMREYFKQYANRQ